MDITRIASDGHPRGPERKLGCQEQHRAARHGARHFPRRHGDLRPAAVQAHLRRGRLLRQDDDLRHPRGHRGEARGAEQVSRAGAIPRSILRKERQRL